MNTKLVIIGGFLVVLMVMFGNNPVEDARKKEEEKYKGIDDPLIRAITEYHEDDSFGTSGARGNGRDDQGRKQKQLPRYMYPAKTKPHQYNNAKSYMNSGGYLNNSKTNAQPTRNNGYYPPPPKPKNSRNQPTQYNRVGQPRSDNHMYLKNGQRLTYRGSDVYIIDASGIARPLPDGKHRLKTGQEIHVVGGRKIIASN